MSRIGPKNTSPEMTVRRWLHKKGYRFRLHRKDLPGTPDIVLPRLKTAIFVHGCFWHAHECSKGRPPKSRPEYWLPKLRRNKERDAEKRDALERAGWTVHEIWQCETKEIESLTQQLEKIVTGSENPIDNGPNSR